MGFEFTFEHVDCRVTTKNSYTKLYNLLMRMKEDLDKIKCHGWYVENSGQIEINSPVFSESNDVLEYYNYLRSKLGKKFVPKNDDSTGGGCHIHADYKNESQFKNIYDVMYNRPYLAWAFNDPYDNTNAEPLGFHTLYDFAPSEYYSEKGYCINQAGEQLKGGETVEFRMFDNPANLDELTSFMQTVNHVYDLAQHKEPSSRLSASAIRENIKNHGLTGFNQFKKEANIKFSNKRLLQRIALERGV